MNLLCAFYKWLAERENKSYGCRQFSSFFFIAMRWHILKLRCWMGDVDLKSIAHVVSFSSVEKVEIRRVKAIKLIHSVSVSPPLSSSFRSFNTFIIVGFDRIAGFRCSKSCRAHFSSPRLLLLLLLLCCLE